MLTILTAHRENLGIGSASTPPLLKSPQDGSPALRRCPVAFTYKSTSASLFWGRIDTRCEVRAKRWQVEHFRATSQQWAVLSQSTQRSRNTAEEEPYGIQLSVPDFLDQSVSVRQNIWTAGGSRVVATNSRIFLSRICL